MSNFKRDFLRLIYVALGILILSAFGGVFALQHWRLDLLSHFQIQYMLGGLGLAAAFAALRKWPLALVTACIALFSFSQIYTAYDHAPRVDTLKPSFSVMHYNRRYVVDDLKELEQAANYMRNEKPDVVVLQEATLEHVRMAESLRSEYPYQIQEPRMNAFGQVVLSRLPFITHNVKAFERIALDNIQINFSVQTPSGETVSIYAIHPPPPTSAALQAQRNMELSVTAADVVADEADNIIMLGDWNITPFSPYFKELRYKGLKNEYTGLLPYPTWPSNFVFPFFQLPIDHILHKGDLQLIEKKRGPAMGSDHYPSIAVYGFENEN